MFCCICFHNSVLLYAYKSPNSAVYFNQTLLYKKGVRLVCQFIETEASPNAYSSMNEKKQYSHAILIYGYSNGYKNIYKTE